MVNSFMEVGGVEFDGVGNNISRALTGSSFVLLLAWIDLM